MTDDEWLVKNPYAIKASRKLEVNTDPQRRCYYGVHAKSEIVQGPWEELERVDSLEKVQRRLEFWTDLNAYAVSQRGVSAKTDYKIGIPEGLK